MRILLVSHEMTYTGAPNSLLNIAKLLKNEGHSVTVQTLENGNFSVEFKKNGFNIHQIFVEEYDYSNLPLKYDVVIANTIFCGGFALRAQEYILTYLYIREGENIKAIIRDCGLKTEYITSAKHLICVSEYAKSYLESNFQINKLSVLHNFIYDENYCIPPVNSAQDGVVHFLIAATIEKRKGISVALKAVKMLPENILKKMVLHIVGRKPEWAEEYWRNLDFNIPSVKYHGEIVDKSEMDKLYNDVNVVVVPSYDEPCSLTALEGAGHGKAIIVTENTGARYIIEGNGIIVKTGSARALADAFEHIITSNRLGEMGQRSFENFMQTSTKEIYRENFIKLLESDFNMNKEEINICFIADNDYVAPTSVAIASICANSSIDYIYKIYIVMPNNSSYSAKRYINENAFALKNVSIKIIETDISDLENLHKGGNEQYIVASKSALLKFKLTDLFPELDKILYLDGDIIVRDNLSVLYGYDLGNKYAAVVRDLPQTLYEVQQLGAEISGRDYFNSGVMLLNLSQMRKDNVRERLIETKKNYKDQSLMDQNIFNIVFKGKVLQLPFLYNTCYINFVESKNRYDISKLNRLYGTNYKDVYEILPDIKIMHFSSKLKPWLFYDVPLADEWLYYYKKSSMRFENIQRTFHTVRNVDISSYKQQVQKMSRINKYGFSKIVPIVFAGNEIYLYYAASAIQSIYENSNSDYLYNINIFVDETVSDNMKRRLSSLKYTNVKIDIWDICNVFNGIDLYSVGHYSRQMYYRWLIPEVLSKYEKVIYFDCDLIVNTDVSMLYDILLEDNYIAAASNFLRDNLINHVSNRLGLSLNEYYNSGVLVINCKQWVENNLKNKCISCLKSYDKLACPDQDVINVVCKGKIKRLDDSWNYQWHHQFPDARTGGFVLDYQQRYGILSNIVPKVIHFTSSIKPWNNPHREFAQYFWKYCRNTEFYESVIYLNITASDIKKCGLPGYEADGGRTTQIIYYTKAIDAEEEMRIRNQIKEIEKSLTYKFSRLISLLPRKIKKYDYSPIPPKGAGPDAMRARLNEIYNSKSFRLAEKLLKLPKKILGKK